LFVCFFLEGYGTRSCIGSILSITEAVVVLASLLQRYIFHLDDDQKKPKISGFGISLSSSDGIFISFRPIASSGDVDDEIKE
jgi:cytochrome P450